MLTTLSWVPVIRTLSAGKLISCREGAQNFGAQIYLLSPSVRALPGGWHSDGMEGAQGSGSQCCLLSEDEGSKGPCPRSSVASAAHVLSCVGWSQWSQDPGCARAFGVRAQDGTGWSHQKDSQPLVGWVSFVPVPAGTRPSGLFCSRCCVPLPNDLRILGVLGHLRHGESSGNLGTLHQVYI